MLQEIPLYIWNIPNSKKTPDRETAVYHKYNDVLATSLVRNVSIPTLTIYKPQEKSANGTSVIICPGGGYHELDMIVEGSRVAQAFNNLGVTAFVLKYRLPDNAIMVDKSIGPLQDAQSAIKIVREKASEWKINPQKIGIMGFSAGGHLAATTAIHFSDEKINNNEGTSLRPDFMILVYPVISFKNSIGHIGSRDYLLGKVPDQSQIEYYSIETQVSAQTPPAFITHASDDSIVSVENSIELYKALRKNSVPAALHIYSRGEHAYLTEPPFDEWFGRCYYWMQSNGYLNNGET